MLEQNFTITLDGTPDFTVTPDARDLRRWEASTGRSWLADDVLSITDMTRLLFHAAARTGVFPGGWDEFDARCVKFTAVEEDNPKASGKPSRTGGERSGG
jgi:hypothetical protein